MTYELLRTTTDMHDHRYCVGVNGEPMTNPTHSVVAAEQAKRICERYKLQGH